MRINRSILEVLLYDLKFLMAFLLESSFVCLFIFIFFMQHAASKNCVTSGRQKPKQRVEATHTNSYGGLLLQIKIQVSFLYFVGRSIQPETGEGGY